MGNGAQLNQENKWLEIGAQFDHRRYDTEMIYSASNEDYDFGDKKIQQVGTGDRQKSEMVSGL